MEKLGGGKLCLRTGNTKPPLILTRPDTLGYTVKERIGSGSSASVYRATRSGFPDAGVKVQHLAGCPQRTRHFWKEAKMAQKMSDAGLGPQVQDVWCTGNGEGGLIACDIWDMSLRDAQKLLGDRFVLSPAMWYKLMVLVKRIHELGLVHGDLLEKNILVRLSGGDDDDNQDVRVVDLTLTDFGLMQSIKRWKRNPDFVKTMYQYLTDRGQTTRHYFEDFGLTVEDVQRDPRHMDLALLYYYDEPEDEDDDD